MAWKLWAIDEENSRFSGKLLFADAGAMQAFLDGELAATLMAHPALSDFVVTPYSVMAPESRQTRRPDPLGNTCALADTDLTSA